MKMRLVTAGRSLPHASAMEAGMEAEAESCKKQKQKTQEFSRLAGVMAKGAHVGAGHVQLEAVAPLHPLNCSMRFVFAEQLHKHICRAAIRSPTHYLLKEITMSLRK